MKQCKNCKYFNQEGWRDVDRGVGTCDAYTILPEPIKKGLSGIFNLEIDEDEGENCMLFDERL